MIAINTGPTKAAEPNARLTTTGDFAKAMQVATIDALVIGAQIRSRRPTGTPFGDQIAADMVEVIGWGSGETAKNASTLHFPAIFLLFSSNSRLSVTLAP